MTEPQQQTPFHIVLVHPEIPPNTGNIGRLCAATGARLHLIEPLGFSLDDRHLKRAGLDYWPYLDWQRWPDWQAFRQQHGGPYWATSKGARQSYTSARFQAGGILVFGCETQGLPASISAAPEACNLRIPLQQAGVRSLNLANAVSIVLFEALRQTGYLDSV